MLKTVKDCYQSDSELNTQLQVNDNNNLTTVLELCGFFEYIKNPDRKRQPALKAPDDCKDIEEDNSIYIKGLGTCYVQSEAEKASREETYNKATINGYQAIGLEHNQYKFKRQEIKEAKKSLNLALLYNKKEQQKALEFLHKHNRKVLASV